MEASETDPDVNEIYCSYGNEGSDFQQLVDVGNFRYHLLLSYNELEPNAAENERLEKLWDAVFRNDHKAIPYAAFDCQDLMWPFIESNYRRARETRPTEIIKLQVVTTNGLLEARTHERHLQFPPTKPIENCFPNVPTYAPSEVIRLEEIERQVFKVQVRFAVYCMKTVHRTLSETDFIREVSILKQCSHPNIIQLFGLVEREDSSEIEAMLVEYIDGARKLRDIESISGNEFHRWTSQITEAVEYLHGRGLVWGDAKAANVLVTQNGDAILIDFGGGYTPDWVDADNQGTLAGDLQGLERIIKWLKDRIQS